MNSKKKAVKTIIAKIAKEVSKTTAKNIPIKSKSSPEQPVVANKLNTDKYYCSLDGAKHLVSNKPKIKRLKLYVWNIGGAHSFFYAMAYSLDHARKILRKDNNIKGNAVREKKLAESPIEFKSPTSMVLSF